MTMVRSHSQSSSMTGRKVQEAVICLIMAAISALTCASVFLLPVDDVEAVGADL